VANYYGSSITVYAPGASGNASPSTTIAGSNTGLSWPWGIARDAVGNLYVVNSWSSSGSTSITVYAPGASGNATPSATITGNNTGLSSPHGIALDAAGRLYVANGGSNTITVYAARATGNAAPIATIAGANAGLSGPMGLACDAGGRLDVGNAARERQPKRGGC